MSARRLLLPVVVTGGIAALIAGMSLAPRIELLVEVGRLMRGLAFFTFAGVGAIVLSRHPRHLVGWAFAVSGLLNLTSWLCEAYIEGRGLSGMPGPFLEQVVVWLASWTNVAGFAVAPLLVLFVFPTGRLASPRWKGVAWAVATVVVGGVLAYGFAPGPVVDYPFLTNPFGMKGSVGRVLRALTNAVWPLLIPSIVAGAASLYLRFRNASGDERQQIEWLALGGLAIAAFVPFWALMVTLGYPDVPENVAGFVMIALPIAAGVAITRYRLYDIDVIINRTLVYGSLTAILAATYFGLVVALQNALAPVTRESDIAVATSTLAVAALFGPARRRVQEFIDRRFYRLRYDAQRTLESFSSHLRDEVDLDHLSAELLGVVGSTMHPRHASLWLRPNSGAGP